MAEPRVPFDAELFHLGLCLIHPYPHQRMPLKELLDALQTRMMPSPVIAVPVPPVLGDVTG